MVKRGIANSSMKDFHDLHSLSKTFEFDGNALVCSRDAERRCRMEAHREFQEDENKIKQWKAFCNKNKPRVRTRPDVSIQMSCPW
jgi:hypothetical protein